MRHSVTVRTTDAGSWWYCTCGAVDPKPRPADEAQQVAESHVLEAVRA